MTKEKQFSFLSKDGKTKIHAVKWMPESGEVPGGQMPGGSSFEASGESITFTLTDDTAITLEYLQGSGEGTQMTLQSAAYWR